MSHTEKELSHRKMVKSTKECGSRANDLALEFISDLTAQNIRESRLMVRNMVVEFLQTKLAIVMMVSGWRGRDAVRESRLGKMGLSTMEPGNKIKSTATENKHGPTAQNTKVNGCTDRKMETVISPKATALIKVSGKMTKSMAKG